MRLVLTGRHVDITPGLRAIVDRKLAKLERQLGNSIISAQVVLSADKASREAEITVHMRGDHMLNGHGSGPAWTAALSAGVDKIERQGGKIKGKWTQRKRRAARATAAGRTADRPGPAPTPAPPAPRTPRIVRVSRGQIKPMSAESAAVELQTRGEAYLVFRNVETDALNVLVRRKAGEFGLIEPEA